MTPFEIYWFNHIIPSLRHLGVVLNILSIIGLVVFLIAAVIQYDCKNNVSLWIKFTLLGLVATFAFGFILRIVFPNQKTIELMLKAMEVM